MAGAHLQQHESRQASEDKPHLGAASYQEQASQRSHRRACFGRKAGVQAIVTAPRIDKLLRGTLH